MNIPVLRITETFGDSEETSTAPCSNLSTVPRVFQLNFQTFVTEVTHTLSDQLAVTHTLSDQLALYCDRSTNSWWLLLQSWNLHQQNNEVTTGAQSVFLKPSNMRSDIRGMYTNEYVRSVITIPSNIYPPEECPAGIFYSSKRSGYMH